MKSRIKHFDGALFFTFDVGWLRTLTYDGAKSSNAQAQRLSRDDVTLLAFKFFFLLSSAVV